MRDLKFFNLISWLCPEHLVIFTGKYLVEIDTWSDRSKLDILQYNFLAMVKPLSYCTERYLE